MGFSTFVCKFVRDGLPKFCCCVAFWCKFSKTFSQRLPADRWTKSVDQIMGPLDLDDIFWLLRIDDFVDGWCPKPESRSLGPSTFTRNTVKDWRWLEYPKRVERNKDAKWCFFWKPKPHQDFLDCEDCQKSRHGSSLSLRKSEHILATKLGIIRILFYLHLTFFFELQSSLHDFPPTFHQAIWPDPFPAAENCNMVGTWKDVLRHHSTSWELRKSCHFSCDSFWAEAQIIFLTGMWPGFNSFLFWHMEKSPCGWYSHYLPCFCQCLVDTRFCPYLCS